MNDSLKSPDVYFSECSLKTVWNGNVELSPKQIITLGLWLMGYSAKHAGKILNISPRRVEQYRDRMRSKFNVSRRDEIRSLFENNMELEKLNEITLGFIREVSRCS